MSEEEQKMFVGKKIKDIDVNGFYVFLSLEDETELFYNATDGGYSSWEIQQKSKGYINCNEIERLNTDKEQLTSLVNSCQEEIRKLKSQLQQKENIIKKVREKIKKAIIKSEIEGNANLNLSELLEILEEENK